MQYISRLIFLALILFSCNEDDINTPISENETRSDILQSYNPEKDIVSGSIVGTIIDEDGNPVVNAMITYEGNQYTTYDSGIFVIPNEDLNKNGTFIKVEKDGYFNGSRRFYPQENSVNYIYIRLLSLNEVGQFNAAQGGSIKGEDGIEISFTQNSIQAANGDLYTGQVSVAAKFIDPTDYWVNHVMPGDLTGVNSEAKEVSLVSFGMMAVELFGDDGSKLNLAPNKEASLSFPIPEALLDRAPAEIPLWSFDEEEYGIWVEEGSAVLQGTKYVGNVSHFSFWNCDVPELYIKISGQLMTSTGAPLANTFVGIAVDEDGTTRGGYTDNNGVFCGFVPRDVSLTLTAEDRINVCGYGEYQIGPFSNPAELEVNLGVVELELLSGDEFIVSGTLLDCNNEPIASNGLVRIEVGAMVKSIYLENSNFNIGLINCDNLDNLFITPANLNTMEIGAREIKTISPIIDCGNLVACGDSFCILPDELFSGSYMITIENNTGLEYGPGYQSGDIVEIKVSDGSIGNREFRSTILPDIGGFTGTTYFSVNCEEIVFQKMLSRVGCGGNIIFGPILDEFGKLLVSPVDFENDSEIVLYFNEGYINGNCDGLSGETQTKMTLIKI